MKKLMAVLVVLALAFVIAGCCKRLVNGVETESFANCVTYAKDYVCNPDNAVINLVDEAMPILIGMTGVDADTAVAIAAGIKKYRCVFLDDLLFLTGFLDSIGFKQARVKAMGKTRVLSFNVQPLTNWANTAKK